MTCDEAKQATLDRAAMPLEAERARAHAAHLAGCEECRAHADEIAALEAQLEDTLASVANTDVARRFRPRSRWAPLAAAAAVAAAFGVGSLVGPGRATSVEKKELARLRVVEPGTELTVGVEEGPVKRSSVALGASVVAIGVTSGAVLLKMSDGQEATVREGETAVAQARAPIAVLSPEKVAAEKAASQKKISALECDLASSRAEARALAAEVASLRSALPAAPGAVSGGVTKVAAPTPDSTPPANADEKVRAMVKKFDWHAATAALVAWNKAQEKGSSEQLDPNLYVLLSKMNVVAGEIAKERGYANPWQAYTDPLVREEYVPAWIDALGAKLDAGQTDALKRYVRDQGAAAGDVPNTYLDALRARLQSNLDQEKFLATLLRPEQLASIDESVGDSPFFGVSLNRSRSRSSDVASLAQTALGEWKNNFDLSPAALNGAQSLAERFAQEAAAIPPVDSTLDTASRRAAEARHAIAVITLQQKVEAELAALPGLTDAERARVKQGSRYVLELGLKK